MHDINNSLQHNESSIALIAHLRQEKFSSQQLIFDQSMYKLCKEPGIL